MKSSQKSLFIRLVALALTISLVVPCTASATMVNSEQSRASAYLTSYNSYVCAMGSGKLQIWFTVVGDTTMDEIGTLKIMLYESSDNQTWTWKKTYLHEDYSSMLRYNNYVHSSYVSYNGTAGKYYKAYVCIWAGKNGSGDTRYMWTASERAT